MFMTFAYQYDSRIALCLPIVPFRCWHWAGIGSSMCAIGGKGPTLHNELMLLHSVLLLLLLLLFLLLTFSRTSFLLKFAWISFFSIWIAYFIPLALDCCYCVPSFCLFIDSVTLHLGSFIIIILRASERAHWIIWFTAVADFSSIVVIVFVISLLRSPFPRCHDTIVVFILYSSSSLCAGCYFFVFRSCYVHSIVLRL